MVVEISNHCFDRIDERFKSNNINKVDYVINTFKKIMKDKLKLKHTRIEKSQNEF